VKRQEWAGADNERNQQERVAVTTTTTPSSGSNGFVARHLKQQSKNEGGMRGEMVMTASGDDD